MTARRALSVGLLAAAFAAPSLAFETSISGFGTLGYTRSDQRFGYQRFVDDGGTLKRDSIFGLQLDTKLGGDFAFTVQGKVAASPNSDSGVRASVAWGFLSWRPSNDWLLRAGKFRVPLYLHSETQDVGTTFDLAALPVEVYSQSPTTDFRGLSASRSWNTVTGDVVLDAYWGRARTDIRAYGRHDLSVVIGNALLQKPPVFLPVTVHVSGLALTVRRDEDLYRLGYAQARLDSRSPVLFVEHFPFVNIPGLPGVGYYDTLDGIASGRVPLKRRITVPVITLGADAGGPFGTRVAAEFGRRIVKETLGFDSKGAYLSVRRRVGPWTPYVTWAVLRSTDGDRQEFAAVNNQRVPGFIPQAALINLLQEAGADGIQIFDQRSLGVGFSYRASPTSMFKAELQRVRVGEGSALIDDPRGVHVQRQSLRVLSLSYSLVF